MSVYRNPSLSVATIPSLPAGWKAAGCIADNVNSSRTLTGYTYASDSMTLASCVQTCSDRGYAYSGVEYGVCVWRSRCQAVADPFGIARMLLQQLSEDSASFRQLQHGLHRRRAIHLRRS